MESSPPKEMEEMEEMEEPTPLPDLEPTVEVEMEEQALPSTEPYLPREQSLTEAFRSSEKSLVKNPKTGKSYSCWYVSNKVIQKDLGPEVVVYLQWNRIILSVYCLIILASIPLWIEFGKKEGPVDGVANALSIFRAGTQIEGIGQIVLILFPILWILGLIWYGFRFWKDKDSERQRLAKVTIASFTLLIRLVKVSSSSSDQDWQKLFYDHAEEHGTVEDVCVVFAFGKVHALEQELDNLRDRLIEAEQSCWRSAKALKKKIKKTTILLHQEKLRKNKKTPAAVFITFSTMDEKQAMLKKHSTRGLVCDLGRWCTDWCRKDTSRMVGGARLLVEEAPPPDDVQWEYLQVGRIQKKWLLLGSLVETVIVMLITTAIITGLVAFRINANSNSGSYFVSFLGSVGIMIVNRWLERRAMWLSKKEGHHARSEERKSLMLRLAFAQIFSVYVAPFLGTLIVSCGGNCGWESWRALSFLVQEWTIFMLVDGVGRNGFRWLLSFRVVYGKVSMWMSSTQRRLEARLKPKPFDLSLAYARLLRNLFFVSSICWVYPWGTVVGILAVLLSSGVDRKRITTFCRYPTHGDKEEFWMLTKMFSKSLPWFGVVNFFTTGGFVMGHARLLDENAQNGNTLLLLGLAFTILLAGVHVFRGGWQCMRNCCCRFSSSSSKRAYEESMKTYSEFAPPSMLLAEVDV